VTEELISIKNQAFNPPRKRFRSSVNYRSRNETQS